LEDLNNQETKEETKNRQLNKTVNEYKEKLSNLNKQIQHLKEKSQNWDKFKHIDMTEISSIVDHNKTMSSFLDAFLNKFQKLNEN